MSPVPSIPERVAEVARSSHGRLIALLSSRTGDLLAAEDAVAEAFRRALETWPQSGVPANPEAWLFTVARNVTRDQYRYTSRHPTHSLDSIQEPSVTPSSSFEIPDERLKLLFVCAHPAIDVAIRAPLMLQTVLGVDPGLIGRAFLSSKDAMNQRLVRAKRKIRDANIPFVLPERGHMPERVASVLEAIYGAYATPWIEDTKRDLASEARFLATLVADLLPKTPEVLGLAALLSFLESRRACRVQNGRFVPLEDQDPKQWDATAIQQAEEWLLRARAAGGMGRFQLEAAIQSVHANRLVSGRTDWRAIVLLYEGLLRLHPTVGAVVGRASALARSHGPQMGLDALDALDPKLLATFQPAWATRAALFRELDKTDEARHAYERALALPAPEASRAYLREQLDTL